MTARLIALLVSVSTIAAAQQQPATTKPAPVLPRDEIAALAKVQIAITAVQDSLGAQLAQPRNKKDEMQVQLRERLRAQVAEVLHHSGMTDAEYRRKTYLVSSDLASRTIFDSVTVALTGQPLPGLYVAPVGLGRGNTPVPTGAVGVHIGHVINSFGDTPNSMGLLAAAMAEAKTAATHAGLATRQPGNLDYMKTHAGHVLNALDPTLLATGPGLGYGLKKAALGVATHIDLAAAAPGASPNVLTHAKHVGTAARNTVTRAEQIIVIAQKIQGSQSAAEAAALTSEMASLCNQLIAGADTNGDGRISWDVGEGGLQHADDHVKLLLAGER